jgi:hypothetical protein
MRTFPYVVRVSLVWGLVVASCRDVPASRPFAPDFAIEEGGAGFGGEAASSGNGSAGESGAGHVATAGGALGIGASSGAGGKSGGGGGQASGGAGSSGGKSGRGGQAGNSPTEAGMGGMDPASGGGGAGGDLSAGGMAGTAGTGGPGGPGGTAGATAGGPSDAGTGGGGVPGAWACGEPTLELDPDGDLLNDACDDDRDEDGIANDADVAPRDPFNPPLTDQQMVNRAAMPGIMLADACVKAAVAQANEALTSAGLPIRLPASLEHEPPALPTYVLRPWEEQAGYWVGGPDATPGAPLDGAEIKLTESAPGAKVSYHEGTFNDGGLRTILLMPIGKLRGNPSSANLFIYGADRVHLMTGSYENGNLIGVATLSVRVGMMPPRTYPNATCPAQLGRWTLSYAPVWRAVQPESFTYACLDDGEAHIPSLSPTWTRDAPPEQCRCTAVFDAPGVRSTIACNPTE